MPIINGQGRVAVRVTGSPSGGGGASYLLDTYGGAAAAYSLRKLSSTYSGNAIRVRRSSDNTETNIGFDGSGNLDEAALTAFVGAGNGFVTTWYDQSGNNVNISQSTATNQPKIVSSGTVNKVNSKPSFTFNGISSSMTFGSNPFYNKNSYSMFTVAKYSSNNTWYNMIISNSDNDIEIRRGVAQDYMQFIMGGTSGAAPVSSIPINNLQRIFSFYRNANVEAKVYINNTLDGTITPNSNNIANTTLYLGSRNGSSFNFDGNMQEIVIYGSSQSANLSSINSNINTYYSIYSPMDSDAQAFITAASITDSTQQSAVNTLVTSLKSAGIWTKMKALYPFVGGTATSHKFNLKDPRDLDAAYRLVFNGGWTHSSTGALPNGTNGYADTKLSPISVLSQDNTSYGFYSRTEANAEYYDMGSYSPNVSVILSRLSGNFYGGNNDNGYDTSANSSSLGLFTSSRTSSTTKKGYRNATEIQNSTRTSTGLNTNNFYLGGISGYPGYSARQLAFSFIGDGLSGAEVSAFYTAVQAFQTTLGRQV